MRELYAEELSPEEARVRAAFGLAKVAGLHIFDNAPDEDEAGWQARALCAQIDSDTFFPEKGGSTREAKRVCLACEVRDECLEYAVEHEERFGVWGGLSERERRKLKKRAV